MGGLSKSIDGGTSRASPEEQTRMQKPGWHRQPGSSPLETAGLLGGVLCGVDFGRDVAVELKGSHNPVEMVELVFRFTDRVGVAVNK